MKKSEPVFVGSKWTLEVTTLPSGKVAGYVTEVKSAHTVAVNDDKYQSTNPSLKVPKTVMRKLHVLMRKAGWVEDLTAHLKHEYKLELAEKGKSIRLPAEYANTKHARLYFPGDVNHEMYVEHYTDQKQAYALWLALPRGVRCAMRNAGETMPVYHHDLVDRM